MELWIRSQDKECLMKVDRVDYDYSANTHRILANGFKTLLARYSTKERALEIINEIQNALSSDFNITTSYEQADIYIKSRMLNGLYGVIYNLPKE